MTFYTQLPHSVYFIRVFAILSDNAFAAMLIKCEIN